MATLNTTNIKHASSSSNNIVLNADGSTTIPNLSVGPNRNLIINGSQIVSQRATQVTGVTTAGYRTCDRFNFAPLNLGTWTVDQSTDSPDGFSNSFKVTCTTADASPSAADYCFIRQYIEAQNLQHLAYGSSSAKETTLSFYVKSNKTGAANAYLYSPDTGKIFSFTYTISSADTWERKTQLIPADTASAIANDNAEGMRIVWVLNSGSNFQGGSVGGWKTFAESHVNVNNLGVGGATSDNFAITGVQLEVSSVATDFEHLSYGDTLAKCQRYYEKITINGNEIYHFGVNQYGSGGRIPIFLRVTKRAIPTVTLDADNWTYYVVTGSGSNGNASFNTNSYSTDAIGMTTTGAGASSTYWAVKSANGYIEADSEL